MNEIKSQSQDLEVKHNNRIKEFKRSIKFLLFSTSAGIIQVASFTFMNEVVFRGYAQDGTNYWISYLIALTLSVIWNFTFNRRYTFKSANNVPVAMVKDFCYYLIFTPLSTLWGDALAKIGWNEYIILGGTMIINFVSEFLFCRFVVFKNSIDTNKLAQKEVIDALEKEPIEDPAEIV